MKEATAPSGYKVASAIYTITVQEGIASITSDGSYLTGDSTNGYQIKNEKNAALIQLNKTYDGQSVNTPELLSETVFTLYSFYDGNTLENEIGNKSPEWDATTGKAIVSFKNLTTPLEGVATYYLKETQAPQGYTVSDTVFECVVDVDGNVNYRVYGSQDALTENSLICNNVQEDSSSEDSSSEENTEESTEDESTSSSEANEEDESTSSSEADEEEESTSVPENKADIKIIKTNDDGTALLEDATFVLYADADCSQVVVSVESDKNGRAVFKDIPDGIYFMKETVSPDGFRKNTALYKVTVEQGLATIEELGDANSLSGNATDGYVIKNKAIVSEIKLAKTYDEKNLSNEELLRATEFTLYKAYDGQTLSGKISSSIPVWDPARALAVVSFDEVKVPTDGEVIYYLKETKSPTKYSLSDLVYECKIDTEGNVTYRIYGTTQAFGEAFPICNNLLVVDPIEPEEPSSSEDTTEDESTSSSESGSEDESTSSSEEDEDESASSSESGSEDESASSSEENPEDGSGNPGDGNEGGSEDDSEESSEDDSENGSEESSEDDSENGSEESSEDNSEDSSEESSEGDSEDSSEDESGKKKKNKKKNSTSTSEEPNEKELDDVPKTGDNLPIGWIILMIIASGVLMLFARKAMNKEDYYDISL